MARDEGWDIPREAEEGLRPQRLENLGKSYMPIGYYRIDCQAVEGDTLYEFDTVHFINITRKIHIEPFPYMVAQLRHGEVVHVYGTGEDNARFYDEEGTEVAPLASLRNGRRRVHVRLPYFGTTDDICGWMTAGAWMVPMQMRNERPFQLLTSEFITNRRGIATFSWDLRDGPFTIERQLNDGSALRPAWMLPTIASSAFQFTSALGYLDIARIVVPRYPRQWQPRGRAEDYNLVRRLEGLLLMYGGAQREQRRLFVTRASMTRDANIRMTSSTIARSVETLATQQSDYNHLEDDDLQHLE
jgi:hypothetical protein